jgi:hypothetical protein
MGFFLQTASSIAKAFVLLLKGERSAGAYIQTTHAHWLLSWLMLLCASLIYLFYLPTAFMSEIAQELIPEDTPYSKFKNVNLGTLIIGQLTGYLIAHLMGALLQYDGSIRRYIISQNWMILATIVLFLPLSLMISGEDSPLITLAIFLMLIMMFFAYRCIKLLLGLNGPKAFLLLLIILVVELSIERTINGWFGLVSTAGDAAQAASLNNRLS